MGSYSVVQCIRSLMSQPLCCSAADAGVSGKRGHGDGSTPYIWLSCIALLPWLPGFPPQAFPTTISLLTSPWSFSLQLTGALPWDCSTILKLQLPAAAPSRRSMSLSVVCMAVARTVWFSFHLVCHRSSVSVWTLSIFPLTQTIAPRWCGDQTSASVPPPAKGRSSPTNNSCFLP